MPNKITFYEEISQALGYYSAAEAHAMLIAFTCSDKDNAERLWIQEMSILLENSDFSDAIKDNQIIQQWIKDSQKNLQDDDYGFSLFLPYNDSLESQLSAFKEWCNGFLYVIGIMQPKMEDELTEFIADMLDFCNIDLGSENNEEELLAFEELCSYVNVGVLLCATNFQATQSNPKN